MNISKTILTALLLTSNLCYAADFDVGIGVAYAEFKSEEETFTEHTPSITFGTFIDDRQKHKVSVSHASFDWKFETSVARTDLPLIVVETISAIKLDKTVFSYEYHFSETSDHFSFFISPSIGITHYREAFDQTDNLFGPGQEDPPTIKFEDRILLLEIAIGGQYRLNEFWSLRAEAGYSFMNIDQTPTFSRLKGGLITTAGINYRF